MQDLFRNGDLDKLLQVRDMDYQVCGQGNAKDYPYLYYPYLTTTKETFEANRVCVKKCPSETTTDTTASIEIHPTTTYTAGTNNQSTFFIYETLPRNIHFSILKFILN